MKRRDIIIGLAAAGMIAALSFLASTSPDGLDRVAKDKGFIASSYNAIKSPLADYLFPGIKDPRASVAVSGLIGVAAVFLLAVVITRSLRGKK